MNLTKFYILITFMCVYVSVQCSGSSGAGLNSSSNINRIIGASDESASSSTDRRYANAAYFQNKLITVKKLLQQNFLDKNKLLMFAQVMPILRNLNKVQKVALSQLVSGKVFSTDPSNERSLERVKRLFGNDSNLTSTLMLPIANDIANMFVSSQHEPVAAMLRSPIIRNRNTVPFAGKVRESYSIYSRNLSCELFSKSICLKTYDYPIDDILQQLRRQKSSIGGMLIDFTDNSIEDGSPQGKENPTSANGNRRISTPDETLMCSSIVKYARPQKARATSGQWKYIVNTIEHTQTLRLERCRQPETSCAYLNDNFDSKCKQVYNYHRLLSWDKKNGLHMDIYKVPTCCSCHVESYKVQYPPNENKPQTIQESFPGSDIGNGNVNGNGNFAPGNVNGNAFGNHVHNGNTFVNPVNNGNSFANPVNNGNSFVNPVNNGNAFANPVNNVNSFGNHVNNGGNAFGNHVNGANGFGNNAFGNHANGGNGFANQANNGNGFNNHVTNENPKFGGNSGSVADNIFITTGQPSNPPPFQQHNNNNNNFRNPLHTLEIPEINYQLEANKVSNGPKLNNPQDSLSKYLEPPTIELPFGNYGNVNNKNNLNRFNNFVQRISSKSDENGDEANFENVELTFNKSKPKVPTVNQVKQNSTSKKEPVHKINYVYHPIIDFFGSNMKEAILKNA